MTMFDVYACPNCGVMNSSKPEEKFKIVDGLWKCFRCLTMEPKRNFQFIQGPSHDEDFVEEEDDYDWHDEIPRGRL